MDWGGWMWFAVDVVGVIILGAAIAYGNAMWSRRSRDPESLRRTEEATRELYHRH